MLNLEEATRANTAIRKLEIGDLLFAEYTCPIEQAKLGIWAGSDYLVHVISGRKTWRTTEGAWPVQAGDTLFFRKGAAIVEQFFDADFCLLLLFLPDSLVRSTVREFASSLPGTPPAANGIRSAARVANDVALAAFLQSMRTYLLGQEKPPEALLRLKLKELVLGLLTGAGNPRLSAYLRSVADGEAPPLPEILEANFRFNLSLEEYASLCHRSLSSFKREFQRCFGEPPGRWLLRRRLEHAAALLRTTDARVTDVAFESGFAEISHFSRAFKAAYRLSPLAYRQSAGTAD
jgi:AraC-like DNA-binding protein